MWLVGLLVLCCWLCAGWTWMMEGALVEAAVEDYRCSLLLQVFDILQKKKENQKKMLVLVPVLPAHQPA